VSEHAFVAEEVYRMLHRVAEELRCSLSEAVDLVEDVLPEVLDDILDAEDEAMAEDVLAVHAAQAFIKKQKQQGPDDT
jgi:hypothetical protein